MTLLDAAPRTAQTSAPMLDVLAERWSPRAFDPDAVLEPGALAGVFEAARWAPSANNSQPWRFIIARRSQDPVFRSGRRRSRGGLCRGDLELSYADFSLLCGEGRV